MRGRSKSCLVSPEQIIEGNEEIDNKNPEQLEIKELADVITQIKDQLPKNDKYDKSFEEQLQTVKWKKIQISDWSYKKIKNFITSLIQKTIKYRLLTEILDDVLKIYKSENENSKEDLNKILDKFHLDIPRKQKTPVRTPFHDYFDSMKKNGVKYREAQKIYKKMDNAEKITWILSFLKVKNGEMLNLVQYEKAQEVLSHHEMALIDEYEQKPKKVSSFNRFMQNYIKEIKGSKTELNHNTIFKQAAEAWKVVPEIEKHKMQEEELKLKTQYEEDYRNFINALPEDRRNTIVNKGNKKKNETPKDNLKQQSITNSLEKAQNKTKASKTKRKISDESIQMNNSSSKKLKSSSKIITDSEETELENTNNISLLNPLQKNKKKKKTARDINEGKISEDQSINNTSVPNNTLLLDSFQKDIKKNKIINVKNIKEEETSKDQSIFNLKKPPESLYKYYALHIYDGPRHELKSSYKLLSNIEKQKLSKKHQKAKKKFLKQFYEYLNSLTGEEIAKFQSDNNMDEEDDDITSISSEESII